MVFFRRAKQASRSQDEGSQFQQSIPATKATPVKMTGTTTFCKDAAHALFVSRGLPEGGMIETEAELVAEPNNPADSSAVAVNVEGARIGYLPGYLARNSGITSERPALGQVQLWGTPSKGSLRVIGWVVATRSPISWEYGPHNPPPITTKQEAAKRQEATTKMVDDALQGTDPLRAQQFQSGLVDGYHYLETIEPIRQLKREGRLEEALVLCYGAIEGAERDRQDREPAPAYTLEAAILHRKRGERDQEIAVLKRWLALCPARNREGSRVQERLNKLLADREGKGISGTRD